MEETEQMGYCKVCMRNRKFIKHDILDKWTCCVCQFHSSTKSLQPINELS